MNNDYSRLFFALSIPPEVSEQLYQQAIAWQVIPNILHYSKKKNYHITLSFMGNTPLSLVNKLIDNCTPIIQQNKLLELSTTTLTTFPQNKAHSLVAYITKSNKLLRLHKQLQAVQKMMGLPYEQRVYVPHVTLARFTKLPEKILLQPAIFHWTSEHVQLFSSQSTDQSSGYTLLHQFCCKL